MAVLPSVGGVARASTRAVIFRTTPRHVDGAIASPSNRVVQLSLLEHLTEKSCEITLRDNTVGGFEVIFSDQLCGDYLYDAYDRHWGAGWRR